MWWNKNKDEQKSENQVLDAKTAHDLATKQLVIKRESFLEDKIDYINRDIKNAISQGELETKIWISESIINKFQLDQDEFIEYVRSNLSENGYLVNVEYINQTPSDNDGQWLITISW